MIIVILFILFFIFVLNNHNSKTVEKLENCATCTLPSENSKLDPIMDPIYNITEVVKNSLLLEDHLNQKAKRCKDCICKHFLLIISYLTEALSLNGSDKIPEIEPSLILYNNLFTQWKSNKTTDNLKIAAELRKNRKVLTNKYILN